jgi:hypothetical protein
VVAEVLLPMWLIVHVKQVWDVVVATVLAFFRTFNGVFIPYDSIPKGWKVRVHSPCTFGRHVESTFSASYVSSPNLKL